MTNDTAEHDRWHEAAGLYALDALDAGERDAFEAHLGSCPTCIEEVRSFLAVAAALPHAVTMVDPPASLRARVMAAPGQESEASPSNVAPIRPPATGPIGR